MAKEQNPTFASGEPKLVSSSNTEKRGYSENRDFKLALLGNVDSGKSTLCGVLSRGKHIIFPIFKAYLMMGEVKQDHLFFVINMSRNVDRLVQLL